MKAIKILVRLVNLYSNSAVCKVRTIGPRLRVLELCFMGIKGRCYHSEIIFLEFKLFDLEFVKKFDFCGSESLAILLIDSCCFFSNFSRILFP